METDVVNTSCLDIGESQSAVEGVWQVTRHLVALLRANDYADSCVAATILDAFQHAWYQDYQAPTEQISTLADLYTLVFQRFQVDLSDEGEWIALESVVVRELRK
jgi:hypothetical protein